jgi:NitT/TauT family transport system substrate-binding protein
MALTAAAVPMRAAAQAALQPVSVVVGGVTEIGYICYTLADRLNYFRDEGLVVNTTDVAGGAKTAEALVGGSADIALGSYDHTLTLQSKGIDITSVALMGFSYGGAIGLTKPALARYKSPKDLKGMTIAVSTLGSAMSMLLDVYLAKGGLAESDVSLVTVGSGPGAVAAVKAGRVEGIVNGDPILSTLIHDGDVVSIADTRTMQGITAVYGGPIASSTILVRPSFAASHPAVVQGFVNAMIRALKFVHRSTLDQIVAAIPASYYGTERASYVQAVDIHRQSFTVDGIMPPANAERSFQILSMYGPLKGAPHVDVAKSFDNSYARKANAKYH